jgi:hypothetical protein
MPCMGSTQRRWQHQSTDLRGVRVRVLGRSPLHGDHHCATTLGPLLTVKIRQPSHEFTFGVGMSFILYPLVLTPVV